VIETIKENQELILAAVAGIMAVTKLIVNITPSENDNLIFAKITVYIEKVIDLFIPNLKKGGGTHGANWLQLLKKK